MKNNWVKVIALSLVVGMFGFNTPTIAHAQEPTDAATVDEATKAEETATVDEARTDALEEAKAIAADMKDQDVKDAVAAGNIPEIVALIVSCCESDGMLFVNPYSLYPRFSESPDMYDVEAVPI